MPLPPLATSTFKKISGLEASPYLREDRLVIECDLIVIKESRVMETAVTFPFPVQVSPPDLVFNLAKLLDGKKGADVTFKVKGSFFLPRIMLALRSPVFNEELDGLMGDSKKEYITIEDMEPAVFKISLHFIYMDTLPYMDDKEMIKHLLVAADRYAMERLKLICEAILCGILDVETVATTLALAEQHQCSKLKDACIELINSLHRTDDLVASQGYEHLKIACPAIFVDMWEKAAKSRKN